MTISNGQDIAIAAVHSSRCAVFCVCEAAADRGAACARHHSCWCPEGALSFRQFRKLHPKWDGLPAEKWLATPDGRAWHADMLQRSTTRDSEAPA